MHLGGVQLGSNQPLHCCPHRLHFEPLEGECMQHPLSPSRVQLHQSQRVSCLEPPEVGYVRLELGGYISELV